MIEGRVPPNDLDAEAAVLSAAILAQDLAGLRGILAPEHFYSDANRLIWESVAALDTAAKPIDAVTLRSHLEARGVLRRVGGSAYIAQILDATPALSNARSHAELVVDKWRVRRLIATAQQVASEGYAVDGHGAQFFEHAMQLLGDAASARPSSRLSVMGAHEILAPLDPLPWVCRELCIGPGRPTLLAGYGYSMKTLSLQAMAMSVALGTAVWGKFACRRGRVLHLDYEQGSYATRHRYKRLAFAHNALAQDLDGYLDAACFPSAYLTSDGAEGTLVRECTDRVLCVIDSFRAAAPGIDENDSACREFLDILTRVSERTGCAFVVVHHAGKDVPDRDRRQAVRGSSAIFDACGTVLQLSGAEAFEPVKVALVKTSASAAGKTDRPKFFLEAVDVPDDRGEDDKAGLRIEHRTEDEVRTPVSAPDAWRRDVDEVLTVLQHNGGKSGSEIARIAGKKKSLVLDALRALCARGLARSDRARGRAGGGGEVWIATETGNAVTQTADRYTTQPSNFDDT